MKRSKFSDSQIVDAVKRVEAGIGVPDICRELGISTATFYKWRAKYGGMDVSMMSRMKELEEDNRRLKKMMAKKAVTERGACIRVACETFRISESGYRYERKLHAENDEVATWLLRLTDNHRNWGFGLCYLYRSNQRRY
jgi:putative transposase